MKKIFIIANWKMNPQNLKEAKFLFEGVKKSIKDIKNIEIVICPPFVYLSELGIRNKELEIKLGAQDCFWEESGPYTGEVSAAMLKNLGCQYVIIGHSGRRKELKETDEMINKKIKTVLKTKLKPILCIDNISQLKKGIKGILQKDFKNLIIAYEPLSAIGTGNPYDWKKAKEMKNKIQKVLIEQGLSPLSGDSPCIIYGGSVDSKNAINYIKQSGFNGLLVGGASLKTKEFMKIVKNISN